MGRRSNPNGKKKGSSTGPQCVRVCAVALVMSWAGLLLYVLQPSSGLGNVGDTLAPAATGEHLGFARIVHVDSVKKSVQQKDRGNDSEVKSLLTAVGAGVHIHGTPGGVLQKLEDDPGQDLDVQTHHTRLMERDGFAMELDEQTNLQVPVFWEPPADSDQLDHVDMIDGQPTIFLMIASYRDWQCRDTATSALKRVPSESSLNLFAAYLLTRGFIKHSCPHYARNL